MALPQRRTDIGPPHYKDFLPPVIQKNYGDWKYHEVINAGLMVHVANSGDKVWTVRVASPRLLATDSLREFADLAEKYCGGISVSPPETTSNSSSPKRRISNRWSLN